MVEIHPCRDTIVPVIHAETIGAGGLRGEVGLEYVGVVVYLGDPDASACEVAVPAEEETCAAGFGEDHANTRRCHGEQVFDIRVKPVVYRGKAKSLGVVVHVPAPALETVDVGDAVVFANLDLVVPCGGIGTAVGQAIVESDLGAIELFGEVGEGVLVGVLGVDPGNPVNGCPLFIEVSFYHFDLAGFECPLEDKDFPDGEVAAVSEVVGPIIVPPADKNFGGGGRDDAGIGKGIFLAAIAPLETGDTIVIDCVDAPLAVGCNIGTRSRVVPSGSATDRHCQSVVSSPSAELPPLVAFASFANYRGPTSDIMPFH